MVLERNEFRELCVERDNHQCVVPNCTRKVTVDPETDGEVHHIIERRLWDDGGWYMDNGTSVCNFHHRKAEENEIPPQAFWRWLDIQNPPLPEDYDDLNINKWGEDFDTPPWEDEREYIKYPSTGHLPFSPEYEDSRVDHTDLFDFVDIPLIITIKMDGSNVQLTREHVAARNGSHAKHPSFDYLKQRHAQIRHEIPEHLQLFGEWLYAKHSIHYGCDCEEPCEDQGPALRDELQLFGVYDNRYNLWLEWSEVERWADKIDCVTVPVIGEMQVEYERKLYELSELGQKVVDNGHEGITIRSKYPFHYGQFETFLGKYVRDGHVDPNAKHWRKQQLIRNKKGDEVDS